MNKPPFENHLEPGIYQIQVGDIELLSSHTEILFMYLRGVTESNIQLSLFYGKWARPKEATLADYKSFCRKIIKSKVVNEEAEDTTDTQ